MRGCAFTLTCAYAIAASLAGTVAAQRPADSYPSRAVTIIIPFAAGAVTALMSGEVHAAIGSVIAMMAQVRAGKAKILEVTSSERVKLLPDVPTVAEQGVPGFEYAPWLGFAAPRATPPAVVMRLNAELVKVAKAPELAERLADDATLMIGGTPEHFTQAVTAEAARWRKLIDETGMKLDH